MNSKQIFATLTIIFLCTGSLFTAAAAGSGNGDAGAGETKAVLCSGCHGLGGEGKDIASGQLYIPRLAGQLPGYFVKSLNAYRNDERSDAMMRAIAKGLSDTDNANLAAYYQSMNIVRCDE